MGKYTVKVFDDEELIRIEEKKIIERIKVFQTVDWLKQVGQELKAIVCYNEENVIVGYLSLVKVTKHKLKAYHFPPYTPYFGPSVFENDLGQRVQILEALIQPIIRTNHIDFMTEIEGNDVYPFLKMGFHVEARQNHLFSNNVKFGAEALNDRKRKYVKKLLLMQKQGDIIVSENEDKNIVEVWKLSEATGERAAFDTKLGIAKAVLENKNISFYNNLIRDKDGNPLAGCICPCDSQRMYYIMGGSKRVEDKTLNIVNYLSLYFALDFASKNELTFDFEGSSLPGIAEYFRSMGAQPVIKYRIQKTRSLYYNFLRFLSQVKKELNVPEPAKN